MFSKVNPFDESVGKRKWTLWFIKVYSYLLSKKYINTVAATDENLTGENWELILTVTDKLSRASPER